MKTYAKASPNDFSWENIINKKLKASTDYVNEQAKHKNFKDFARGKVNFKVGKKMYSADIIVGIDGKNKAVLYDIVGIKNKEIADSVYTANQTKNDWTRRTESATSNSISNKNENVNTSEKKFSLSQPVEKVGDLVAVHNLSFEKIRGNIELGGIPAPSIAVTKAEMGHQAFGEITLVFKSDTIDPMLDSRNDVFSADAYTSRFPDIEVKINDNGLKDIAKRIGASFSMLEANEFSKSQEGDIVQALYFNQKARETFYV